jgi:hypothetical protein
VDGYPGASLTRLRQARGEARPQLARKGFAFGANVEHFLLDPARLAGTVKRRGF